MANPSNVKMIMDNWIEKSEHEIHIFNKYIALWIAFNAYYSSVTNGLSDGASIKILKEQTELKDWYIGIENSEEIANLLAITPITNMKYKTDIIIDKKENFAAIIDTLYQIRNNLFHGSKSDHVERDLLVVTVALPILKKMVVFCQSNFNKIEF